MNHMTNYKMSVRGFLWALDMCICIAFLWVIMFPFVTGTTYIACLLSLGFALWLLTMILCLVPSRKSKDAIPDLELPRYTPPRLSFSDTNVIEPPPPYIPNNDLHRNSPV